MALKHQTKKRHLEKDAKLDRGYISRITSEIQVIYITIPNERKSLDGLEIRLNYELSFDFRPHQCRQEWDACAR